MEVLNLNGNSGLSERKEFAEGFVRNLNYDLDDIKHSFITIGFRLQEAMKMHYAEVLGYDDIFALAEEKWGFKKSSVYGFIQVWEFAHDSNNEMHIAKHFDKFSYSQLVEMSRCKFALDNYISKVYPTDSVKDIQLFTRFWNKYVLKNSVTPSCSSVRDCIENFIPKSDFFQISGKIELNSADSEKNDSIIQTESIEKVESSIKKEVTSDKIQVEKNKLVKQEKFQISGKSEKRKDIPIILKFEDLISFFEENRIEYVKYAYDESETLVRLGIPAFCGLLYDYLSNIREDLIK